MNYLEVRRNLCDEESTRNGSGRKEERKQNKKHMDGLCVGE